MAAHDKAAIIESLTNGWTARSGPAAGTTAVASVSAPYPTTRINVTQLGWSMANVSLTTGPQSTLSARVGSIAGTVIASWTLSPVGFGSIQDAWEVDLQCKKGRPVSVQFETPSASVIQTVSIAGWYDTLSDG